MITKPLLHQERAIEERAQLIERYNKLGAFIVSEDFKGVDPAEASCLIRQHAAMGLYLIALNDRVSLWEGWEH